MPKRDTKRRKGPSAPEQLAMKQAREYGEDQPVQTPPPPENAIAAAGTSEATEPATQDNESQAAASPAASVPAFTAPTRAARPSQPASAFRTSRQGRQQIDRLSIPTVVQARFKGDLFRIAAIAVVMAAILGALTVVLG
ncbi:MAG: hypothetical protein C1O27_001725 [Chloroflexi bacterium]|jgi:hypothetical protein|nr:MAG: hypothetical protein C1O27_001725 [Chloroflexota bacterium]